MIEFEIIEKASLGRIREIAYQTWPEAYKNVITPEQIDWLAEVATQGIDLATRD